YLPNPAHAAVYDTLFQEYERLHDYFGRGENPVLKKLAAIKAAAGG
ncbi:MAG TPA: Ribulokinase, partial [Clostridia bacterium]|nr:Ribulokinase [Clostridia bacterium]